MGGIVSGFSDMLVGGVLQSEAEHKANDQQYARERAAATAGVRQAQDDGNFQQGQIRAGGSQLAAEQAAAYSDSGVDAGYGTAANTQANTQMKAELDAQQAKNNAARQVWGFKQQKKQAGEEHESRTGDITRKGVGSVIGGAGKMGAGVMSMFGGGG